MKTLRDLKLAAKKLNASVEDDKSFGFHECRVEAPKGYIWVDGVHEFVDSTHEPWKPDYEDLINRMSFGVVKCDDPDCEWCNS